MRFAISIFKRHPKLDVILLDLTLTDVGSTVYNPAIWDIERFYKLFSVSGQLFVLPD